MLADSQSARVGRQPSIDDRPGGRSVTGIMAADTRYSSAMHCTDSRMTTNRQT